MNFEFRIALGALVMCGFLAGYTLRYAQEPAPSAKPPIDSTVIIGGFTGSESPCTDSIVSASAFSACPDHRQHIAQVVSHEFDADQLVCVCEKGPPK